MSNLGDLAYNLTGNSTSFVGANDRARASNDVMSGSVNTIIGQLMRQKKAYEDVGKSTLDYIAADKRASDETKEHARVLLAEVDALKKLASARNDPALQMMNRTAQANDPFQVGLRQMGVDRGRATAEAERDASDPFLNGMARWQKENDAWQRGMNQMRANHEKEMAERKKQAADKRAEAERDAKDPFLNGMARYQKENDPFQRGLDNMAAEKSQTEKDREYRINAARKRDAFEEEDRIEKENQNRVRQRNNENRRLRRDEVDARNEDMHNSIRREMTAKGSRRFEGAMKDSMTNATSPNGRVQWAGVEGFRAIEDFAQGSAYGGLRGGLLAMSNNISQMGTAFGPVGAMVGSVASLFVILGSNAYEAWRKSATGGEAALANIKEYDRMVSSVLQHTRQMQDAHIEARGIRNESTFGGAQRTEQLLKDDISRRELDIKARGDARSDMLSGMGAAGMRSADLDNEARRREETLWGLRRNAASAQAANLSDEALNIDNRNKVRELERDDLRANEQLVAKKWQLQIAERVVLERGQHDADVQEAKRRAHERGGRGPITEWEQMDLSRGRRNAQNQRDMDKFTRGQSWMQSRSEDLLLAGMRDPKDQAAFRAEKEHQESLRRSAEAEKLGIMTADERARMDKASMEKRDREMREAKFGNLQSDGSSGFQSADIKSTQGVNAVIKAMRFSEQDKTIAKLKENGDIAAEQLASQLRVEELLKTAPIPVVDF